MTYSNVSSLAAFIGFSSVLLLIVVYLSLSSFGAFVFFLFFFGVHVGFMQ